MDARRQLHAGQRIRLLWTILDQPMRRPRMHKITMHDVATLYGLEGTSGRRKRREHGGVNPAPHASPELVQIDRRRWDVTNW
jgi:hypothetical protein